ncbi:MAG: 3-oxoacyl-ACP reductase FabG [Ignavibacteriae bacterium]|nr:3-oxoacyl-ACP reductase FabG [Ignavibacteriota bacterium]
MKFKNKVVLVTGSSRGIGKATAIEFAKEGAKVVVNYNKSKNEAESVVNDIKKLGSDAISIKCDVSDEKQVKHMIDKAVKTFGKLDILVNNAGVVFDVPFFKRTLEQWKRTIDVDLIGVYICSKYAAQHMMKYDGGRIINISSTNGISTYHPDSIDYSAAKAGVINLTKSMAMELALKILVNTVAPGWIDTKMNTSLPKDYVKEELEKIFLKRFGKPEEIAKVVLFLASEDSSYLTGSVIMADGGYQ